MAGKSANSIILSISWYCISDTIRRYSRYRIIKIRSQHGCPEYLSVKESPIMSNPYEVLSPYGDIDPIPLKGISARLPDIAGKKIGLFCNYKPTARPLLTAIENRLKEKYPDCQTSWYTQELNHPVMKMNKEDRDKFEDWVKANDGIIAAMGD
jgi:hypothetical protein